MNISGSIYIYILFVLIKIHKNQILYYTIIPYYTIIYNMDNSIYPEIPSQLIHTLLHQIYMIVYFLWMKATHTFHIARTILNLSNLTDSLPPSIEIPAVIKTQDEIYIENEKNRFLKLMNGGEDLYKLFNTNTDSEFYDIAAYKNVLLTENNSIESKWRKNILYECTPRGNLIMFYDAYKKGFSYYSDNRSLSYPILNAVAMKYTRVFSCIDLFMDDSIYPERPSQLLSIYEKEEKKETEKKKSEIPIDKELLKKAPFAKLKKYNQLQSTPSVANKSGVMESGVTLTSSSTMDSSNTKQIGNKSINKFMYLGKINNFSIIQKIPKKKVILNKMPTSYDALFHSNHELQKIVINKETFSYKDFKTLKTSK